MLFIFLLSSLFALFIVYFIKNLVFSDTSQVPGPILNKLSKIPLIIKQIQGTSHEYIYQLHIRYGDTVMIAPNLISILNSEDNKSNLRLIYGNYDFKKSHLYRAFEYSGPNIFTTNDKIQHQNWKKIMIPTYSTSYMKKMDNLIETQVGIFIDKISSVDDPVVNFYDQLKFLSFDIVGEIAFGGSFRMLQNGGHQITKWIEIHHRYVILSTFIPLLKKIKKFVDWGTGAQYNIIQFTKNAIENRRNIEDERFDILGFLINHEYNFSLDQLVAQSTFKLIAATDTTSNTILWTLYLLLKNSKENEKVKTEIRSVFSKGMKISMDMIRNMEFINLEYAIKESMRLLCVTPFILPRITPNTGSEINGYKIPPGCEVGITTYALHRDENYWIKPDEFIPSRFDPTSKYYKIGQDQNYAPFSYGVRACLGRTLSLNQIKLTLVNLLLKFDLELVSKNPQPRYFVTLKPKDLELKIRVIKL